MLSVYYCGSSLTSLTMTANRSLLYFTCLASLATLCFCSVPLSQFFPYGPGTGDINVPVSDDGSSPQVFLSTAFPFFNYSHTSLWVNVNGAISFLSVISTFTPVCTAVPNNYRMIAPFWCDIDLRDGGAITYREANDSAVLQKANAEVANAFPDFRNIQLKWTFITTYLRVPFYGSPGCSATNIVDTFQAILATDNIHSFAIFYYNTITWTTGRATNGTCAGLGGTPAKAGFDAGDGRSLFVIPGSCTSDIITIVDRSNVGSPGKFIFRVDLATIESAGNMTMQPESTTVSSAITPSSSSLPPPPTEHSCACTRQKLYLDVVLVIDISASITPNGLSTIVAGFLASTFNQFTVSQAFNATRVAVVTFSNNAQIRANLTTFDAFKPLFELLTSLARSPTSENIVNIAPALEAAETILYGNGPLANGSYTNGNRINAPDLVILVASDTSITDATGVANRIKARNGTIITLAAQHQGTGSRPDLSNLASPGLAFPSESPDLHNNITQAVCAINCYCPAGYTRHGTTAECVFASDATSSWSFAGFSCADRSPFAYLADELSPDKHLMLQNIAIELGFFQTGYWTGLFYNATTNSYQWQLGTGTIPLQANSYQTWAAGSPNSANNKNCVYSTRTFGFVSQWKNDDCNQFYRYFCQFPACDTDNFCTEAQALGHMSRKRQVEEHALL